MASNSKNIAELLNTEGTITSADIADGGIAAVDISNGSVTSSKLDTNIEISGKLDVAAMSKTISVTAISTFIYDTSNDSDGGAWRKRTTGTSWYNETLNTSVRGARKDFPSVAVIVAETDKVTIYDGDDPDMPMWMVFESVGGASTHLIRHIPVSCISMLNGIITIGVSHSAGYGLGVASFIKDRCYFEHTDGRYEYNQPQISSRNSLSGIFPAKGASIVNNVINDVTMKVLDNSPVDTSTGLPIPSIAIATGAGVSVIHASVAGTERDNGRQITNKAGGAYTTITNVLKDHFAAKTSGDDLSVISWTDSESSINYLRGTYNYNANPATNFYPFMYGNGGKLLGTEDGRVFQATGTQGLVTWDIANHHKRHALQNRIGHNYNTGWMVGNNKFNLGTDTDTTDLSDSTGNLVTNGDFSSSDLTSYTIVSDEGGSNTFAVSGGSVTFTASGAGNYVSRYQEVAVEAGKKYQISTNVTASSGSNARVDVGKQSGVAGTFYPSYLNNGGELFLTGTNADGSATNGLSPVGVSTGQFTCTTSGNIRVGFRIYQNGSITCDRITVKEMPISQQSQTLNPRGFINVGTVTKQLVATGAEITSFGGFSDSNYLIQPHDPALDAGTDTFSVMFWLKVNSGNRWNTVMTRGTADATESLRIAVNPSSGIYFDYGNGSQYAQSNQTFPSGEWVCVSCEVSAGKKGRVFINGIEQIYTSNTVAPTTFLTGANYHTVVGTGRGSNTQVDGELCLIRYSMTTPSDEQIQKVYEQEKSLFHHNSASTLYSTNQTITDFDYDEGTQLLQVGTTSGRSVFSGIRRVENTTDAVDVSISANNGMIAEE